MIATSSESDGVKRASRKAAHPPLHGRGGKEDRMGLIDTLVEAVDQTFDAIMITDVALDAPGPGIVYANPAFCRMTGYSADELVGMSPRILQGPRTDREVLDRLRGDLDRNGSFLGRAVNYRRDGSEFVMEWSISALRGDDGEPQFYVAVQRDVTTFQRLLEDAERLAQTDALTGISNRRYFDAHLAALLARPSGGGRVGLISLDVDHFKSVNDTYGHAAGDAVLQEVARRIRAAIPSGALAARVGGEEFAVILEDASDYSATARLAEHLARTLRSTPTVVGTMALDITASFGTAQAVVSGSDPRQLTADADHALYRSKAAGRDRVTKFTLADRREREANRAST
jgi:diguanylate cyclase (GGDEF)-like protein/PAS domain S-box-containing protein